MSKQVKPVKNSAEQLEAIADRAYAVIAEAFPVCAVSDEFYFFPQVVSKRHDWGVWDDFSLTKVEAVADSLLGVEQELLSLDDGQKDNADATDCQLLHRALRTLREQLLEVSPQKTQPTFHLTVLAAGLAEALLEDGQKAWSSRVAGVPEFLQRAADCLDGVPELFLRLGIEMLADLQEWIRQLRADGLDTGELLVVLQGFYASMQQVEVTESHRLSEEWQERLVVEHIGCDLGIDNLWSLLNDELREMEELLMTEVSRLLPGCPWGKADQHMPFVAATGDDLHMLYRRELAKMEGHIRQHGMVPDNLSAEAALEIAAVPQALTAIRASEPTVPCLDIRLEVEPFSSWSSRAIVMVARAVPLNIG